MKRQTIQKFKKKLTKKYLKELDEAIKYFFYSYGTLRVPNFEYMAMALGYEPDDELFEQGIRELDKQFRITLDIDHNTLEWLVDSVLF